MGIAIGGVGGSATASPANAAAPTTRTAVIRYNVTPVDGLFPPRVGAPSSVGTQMALRFLDTGAKARVLARLIEVDLATGAELIWMTFDSDAPASPAANKYQVGRARTCDRRFDFVRKAYYVEATLTVTSNPIVAGTAAGIEIIKIENQDCRG